MACCRREPLNRLFGVTFTRGSILITKPLFNCFNRVLFIFSAFIRPCMIQKLIPNYIKLVFKNTPYPIVFLILHTLLNKKISNPKQNMPSSTNKILIFKYSDFHIFNFHHKIFVTQTTTHSSYSMSHHYIHNIIYVSHIHHNKDENTKKGVYPKYCAFFTIIGRI